MAYTYVSTISHATRGLIMYNHAPEGYVCPFCSIAEGIENEHRRTKQSDIVYRDEFITAFMNVASWGINKGNVIIIPNRHFENLYDLPADYSSKIREPGCMALSSACFSKIYR